MKLGKLEIDLDGLANFIVKAKKTGYAGEGKYQKADDGSKIFTFQEGNFYYEDNYNGSSQAPGREIVKWENKNGQWIWFMSYLGGMLPEFWEDKRLAKKTFSFLKKALLQITPEKPFRGAEKDFFYNTQKEKWGYFASTQGDITRFLGKEIIMFRNNREIMKEVFSQDYIGGLVIPK